MRQYILTFISLFFSNIIFAQAPPANDECMNAIHIRDARDWCSRNGEFTNVAATPSQSTMQGCFNTVNKDVWFSFTAVALDVRVIIRGATRTSPGGTLRNPEGDLYVGECGEAITLGGSCQSDKTGDNIIELYKGGLTVGTTYFVRVQGFNNNSGTFQLCIKNYNPPKQPGADCPESSVLCDKSSFTIKSVTGAGKDTRELNSAPCFQDSSNPPNTAYETNSTWFSWTAATSGTLTFTLNPTNATDDLDFVVYELPNGVKNCANKIVLRCGAAGESQGSSCKPIWGPTGLGDTDTDVSENGGCSERQNGFLKALDMVKDKSYALVVNNYSSTGHGFSVTFGGTGTFLGPQADFKSDRTNNKMCIGESVTFTDNSSYSIGKLVKWTWSFGEGAEPHTMTGVGPHKVEYTSAGRKSVVLSVESDKGCIVTDIETFDVDTCCTTLNAISATAKTMDVQCPENTDGTITLTPTSKAPPFTYKWSNGATSKDMVDLPAGKYTVTITNAYHCDTTFTYEIKAQQPINADTLFKMPTCNGGQDGSLELKLTGGSPPYRFQWSNGETTPKISNLPIGIYVATVTDAKNCVRNYTLPLNELELVLDAARASIIRPTCNGFADGSITVFIKNGLTPYQYDFGLGMTNNNQLKNIRAGTYPVRVQDANLCKGNFTFNVTEPLALSLKLDTIPISCFGANDGKAIAYISGGTPKYRYFWSNNAIDSITTGLRKGIFTLTVTDANKCEIKGEVFIKEPPRLFVSVEKVQNVICNGQKTGAIQVLGSGGTAPYQYSINNIIFQQDTTFKNLAAGTYTVVVQDTSNCKASITTTIKQPDPFFVNAGVDQTIELGYTADINAVISPTGYVIRQYTWTPDVGLSCKNCPNPIAKPPTETTYTVTAIDNNGCKATDNIIIRINRKYPVYIPNVFSPDEDGNNDRFTLYGGPAASQVRILRIYNRWGSLVYEGKNIPLDKGENKLGWDGTFKGQRLPPDVFAYYAEVEFIDGVVETFVGDVTILR